MEPAYVLGIDPGYDGGFALFLPETEPFAPNQLIAMNTPCITVPFMKNGKKRERREMDYDAVWEIITQYKIVHAFIERVHAMPKQGGTGMFRFGENFGQWQGLCRGIGLDKEHRHFPTPQAWKKRFELHADKKGSIELAKDIFPLHESTFRRKTKDDGVAEACLIAIYGAESLGYDITNLPVLFS